MEEGGAPALRAEAVAGAAAGLAGRAGARWGAEAAGAALLWARRADREGVRGGGGGGGAEEALLGALLRREDGGPALVLEAYRRAAGAGAGPSGRGDGRGSARGEVLARLLARRWRAAAAWRGARQQLRRALKQRRPEPSRVLRTVVARAGGGAGGEGEGRGCDPVTSPPPTAVWEHADRSERERARAEATQYFTTWPVPVLAEAARVCPGGSEMRGKTLREGAAAVLERLEGDGGPAPRWSSLPLGVRTGLLEAALLSALNIPLLLASMHAPTEARMLPRARRTVASAATRPIPDVAIRLLLAEGAAGYRALHPALLAEAARRSRTIHTAYVAHLRHARGLSGVDSGEGWVGGEYRRRVVHLTWR